MKAVILAGGFGTRLKPLTEKRPKPLIPVAGRPCIDYVIRSLVQAGFPKMVITTGYMSDTLIRSMGDGSKYNANILYSFEGEPMGTAGAVKKVGAYLDETFVVASGDVLADVDIKALYDYHKDKKAIATIALTSVDNPTEFGIVDIANNGRIKKFKEKPKPEEVFSNLVNAGIYIFEPEALDFIPEGTFFDFAKDVFPRMLAKKKPLYGMLIEGLWMDIGRPRDLLTASLEVVKREGKVPRKKNFTSTGKIIMGKNVKIEPGVTINGPCYIGDNVTLQKKCFLENACIYEGVSLDRSVNIQDSIILGGTRIGWRSQVLGSVISENVTIEEDCKVIESIIGDEVTINIHSKVENANISPR